MKQYLKKYLVNITILVLSVTIFFGGLEIAQRIRYWIREGEKSYLLYGFRSTQRLKNNSTDTLPESMQRFKDYSIDTFPEVHVIQLNDYVLYKPGDYIRTYKRKTFPVHINKLGFRGKEIEAIKSEGTFRIVLLGGSSTVGLESPDDATITSILEQLIEKENIVEKIEVINAGMGARATAGILVVLKKEILPLKPDIIIVYSAFNDYRHAGIFDAAGLFSNNIIRTFMGKSWGWFYNHSLLFASIYEKFTLFPKKTISFKQADETFRNYKENMQAIIDTTQENGIPLVMVKQVLFVESFPFPLQDKAKISNIENRIKGNQKVTFGEAYYWMHSMQLGILDSLSDIVLVDPISRIEQYHDKAILFHDIVHLTEKGNALLAESIFKELLKRNLIRAPLDSSD